MGVGCVVPYYYDPVQRRLDYRTSSSGGFHLAVVPLSEIRRVTFLGGHLDGAEPLELLTQMPQLRAVEAYRTTFTGELSPAFRRVLANLETLELYGSTNHETLKPYVTTPSLLVAVA